MRLRMVFILLVQGACAAVEPTGEDQASLEGDPITTTPAFRVGWAKALGEDGILWGLFAGSNRVFVSGAVSDRSSLSPRRAGVVIAALSPSGAPLWHRTFAFGSVDNGVVVGTPDDDVIVTGSRTGTTDVGCGPVPASGGTRFIARYTGATGFCQWMRVWPTHGDLSINTVGVAPDGGLLVWGFFLGTVDLGGGNVLVNAGEQYLPFIARLDRRGHGLWASVLRGTGPATPSVLMQGATTDESGTLYVGGQVVNGAVDIAGRIVTPVPGKFVTFVVALDAAGAVKWLYQDVDGNLQIHAMHTRAGRLAVVGTYDTSFRFAGALQDGGGTFVLDFGLDGHQHWARTLTSTRDSSDVAVDEADRVNVVGEYHTPSIQLGTLTLPGSDQSDINIFTGASPKFVYLAALDGNTGAVVRANAFGPTYPEISFLNTPSLSFGSPGLRLMGISYVYGRAQFGSTIVGQPASDEITDAVFMTLVR